MRRLLLLLFMALVCLGTDAQDLGKINLGVVVPSQIEGVDASFVQKLKTKIEQICVRNDVSCGFVYNSFVIYPVFEIYSDEVVETGMQNVNVVQVSLTLFIKQCYDGTTINSISKNYKGSGLGKNKALVNCLSSINVSDKDFVSFIEEGKKRILSYYATNCERIKTKAQSLSNLQQYEEAIALLLSVPEECPCYSEVLTLSEQIYKQYLDFRCEYILGMAKSAVATLDYEKAAYLISAINPASSCQKEAQKMLSTITTKMNEIEKRNWDMQVQIYKDNAKLKEKMIDGIRDIAVAYCSSQPQINYTQVIK